MIKKRRRKTQHSALWSAVFKLIIVILTCFALKASSAYSEAALLKLSEWFSKSDIPTFIIKSELFRSIASPGESYALDTLLWELPFPPQSEEASEPDTDSDAASGDDGENKPAPEEEQGADQGTQENTASQSSDSDTGQGSSAVETTITGETGQYYMAADGIYLKNDTEYEIDIDELLSSPLSFSAGEGAQVLIIHTHGSEAYVPDEGDSYVASDPSRTLDKDYNVVRVGDELEKVLTERGITVIHDTELYDYPNYNDSYSRAWTAISAHLEENPNIKVVIDLHRDALESSDGTVYKTVADIGDSPCAQVMLIAGTDYSGLKHDNWRENLKFAMKLQAEMVLKYPSLARPLTISKYRYNQHATLGSLIVEVGCSGNTLSEALNAVTYFGDCLADVLENG